MRAASFVPSFNGINVCSMTRTARGNVVTIKAMLQLRSGGRMNGEEDVWEVAGAGGGGGGMGPGKHDVGEIDRLLSRRGNINDARRRARLEERHEQAGQQETREVVHGEAEFVAVSAGLPP